MTEPKLPPLPKKEYDQMASQHWPQGYTADQMRDYARAALAAQPTDAAMAALRELAAAHKERIDLHDAYRSRNGVSQQAVEANVKRYAAAQTAFALVDGSKA